LKQFIEIEVKMNQTKVIILNQQKSL